MFFPDMMLEVFPTRRDMIAEGALGWVVVFHVEELLCIYCGGVRRL